MQCHGIFEIREKHRELQWAFISYLREATELRQNQMPLRHWRTNACRETGRLEYPACAPKNHQCKDEIESNGVREHRSVNALRRSPKRRTVLSRNIPV